MKMENSWICEEVEKTEIQLLRLLANTPLQIRPTFIYFDTHKSNSKQSHFDAFYKTISQVKKQGLDGLIITGANLEEYDFEEIFYWKEFASFLDWARQNVTSSIFSCWAVHASLYYYYGIKPRAYSKKQFGIFKHTVHHESGSPLLTGMDDEIMLPHSRWRGIEKKNLAPHKDLEILIDSKEAGPHLIVGHKGREIYLQGHPEYD